MTYTELAERRGIDRASAVRLAIRRHWRRQKSNTGREVRVLVPPDALSSDTSEVMAQDMSGHTSEDISSIVSAFDATLTSLREQLGAATARADRLDLLVEIERGRIVAMEAKAAAQTADAQARADRADARADLLQTRVTSLANELRASDAALDRLQQADDARRALSRWARAWGALRGR